MNKPPEDANTPDILRHAAGERRVTRRVLAFAFVAYLVAPAILAFNYAGGNCYTRMEQWYTMNISLQSVDPARIAIDDPEADIQILDSLLSPKLRSEGFGREQHEFWRAKKDWAIRDGEMKSFEIAGDSAKVVMQLYMDTATEEGIHFQEIRETSRWEKIGRNWYLDDLKRDLVEDGSKPRRGVITP